MNCYFRGESLDGVISLQLFKLNGSVLIKELVNRKVTSANTNLNVIFFNLDCNSLRSKLVDTLRLTHEHDLELLAIGVVVDVLRQLLVDDIALHWDVDCDARLEVNDVLAQ